MYGVLFNRFFGWSSVALDSPHDPDRYKPLRKNEEIGLSKKEANKKAKKLRGEL